MMTDPIADMLTRIRNAILRGRETVDIPLSSVKGGIVEVLKREGYISDYRRVDVEPQPVLRVYLKYGTEGEPVIREIKRVSKPSRRYYSRARDLKPVMNGLGIAIVSTSKGLMSDREARKEGVGGEVLIAVN